jgi:hypothetical protein
MTRVRVEFLALNLVFLSMLIPTRARGSGKPYIDPARSSGSRRKSIRFHRQLRRLFTHTLNPTTQWAIQLLHLSIVHESCRTARQRARPLFDLGMMVSWGQ